MSGFWAVPRVTGCSGFSARARNSASAFFVEQAFEHLLVHQFDLLDLVGGAETVEEVQERNAGLDGDQVGDAGQVHHFLNGTGGQHGESGLAGGHDVLVVAEDGERLCGQCARRYVEHAREQLARNLVHVGDHQQQTLRCGEGRG